jgi:hypothetical protein
MKSLHGSDVGICSICWLIIVAGAFGSARESDSDTGNWLAWDSGEGEKQGADATIFAKVDNVAVGIVVYVSFGVVWSLRVEGSDLVMFHGFVASFSRNMEYSLIPTLSGQSYFPMRRGRQRNISSRHASRM